MDILFLELAEQEFYDTKDYYEEQQKEIQKLKAEKEERDRLEAEKLEQQRLIEKQKADEAAKIEFEARAKKEFEEK